MSLAHPLGLLALLALPLIWWLHRHVVQAKLREVSCLALWADRELVRNEGAQRQRVPDKVVLALELLAALALSALLAGLDFSATTTARATVGLVIDGSASMAGGAGDGKPLAQVRALLRQLSQKHRGLQVSMVVAGELPELLGERVMSADRADALLAAYEPHASACNLAPALELMSALGVDAQSTWLFSDDPELEHPRLVRVGRPADNVGIVAAGWEQGEPPFVVLERSSQDGKSVRVTLQLNAGGAHSESTVALAPGGGQPFALPVATNVERVDVSLPDDALLLDNHVTLFRPNVALLQVRSLVASKPLASAVDRAVRSTGTLWFPTSVTSLHPTGTPLEIFDADLTISDDPAANATAYPPGPELVFLTHGSSPARLADQPEPDPFAPLMSGFDPHGLIWMAFDMKPPPDAHVLLQGGGQALIWRQQRKVFVDVDVEHGNLLSHPAFPILFANLGDELVRARGGLPRKSYRQGERLRFEPPRGSEFPADVRMPSGRTVHFERGQTIDLGVLSESGVYSLDIYMGHEPFAVSLSSSDETALSRRLPPAVKLPALAPTTSAPGLARSQLRIPLLLLLLLACGLAFLLLDPRSLRFLQARTRPNRAPERA